MKENILIAPSILSADFCHLGEDVKTIETAGADWLHIDVMDGHFVPNISMGPTVCEALRAHSKLFFDVHLMVTHPDQCIDAFVNAGCDQISFHCEIEGEVAPLIHRIHERKKKAGLAVKPGTDLQTLAPYLDMIDCVTIMTVEPGFGGQSFMPEMIPRVRDIKRMIQKSKRLETIIQVDGGVGLVNTPALVKAGARCLVAGNSIFVNPDPGYAVRALRAKAMEAIILSEN